jgi:hypothetical protein
MQTLRVAFSQYRILFFLDLTLHTGIGGFVNWR